MDKTRTLLASTDHKAAVEWIQALGPKRLTSLVVSQADFWQACESQIDLIVLDEEFLQTDLAAFLLQLDDLLGPKTPPVLLISREAGERAAQFSEHVDGFLEAPVRAGELQVMVDVLMRQREQCEEQQELQAQLLEARHEAASAYQSKSRFLANMSHEMRTPLGAMLGFAGLLQEDATTAEERHQFLETIIRNGLNLNLLIDDILDLSRVEAQKMEFEHVAVDMKSMLDDVLSALRPLGESKELKLETEWIEGAPLLIMTDPARVRQILMNIIGNAIKFTSQGSVHVRVLKQADGLIRFEVSDTGRGISPEYQSDLFQAFSQGDSSTTRRYGGTGLGLVLSKLLAERLGGDVALMRSQVGKGSTFAITLAAEAAPDARPNKKPEAAHQQLAGLRVLIADDSPDNRLLLKRILTRQGVIVGDVENGLDAVRRAKDYDAVLMDIQMPVLDGYHATERLRAEGYPGPIIALTAHAMKDEKDHCLAVGCSAYLTKPIDVPLLLKSLARTNRSEVRTLH